MIERVKLKHVNTGLLLVIIVVNGYVIAGPFVPDLNFWWQNRGGNKVAALERQVRQPSVDQPDAKPNSLIIPSMLLDQPVLEAPKSQMYSILDKGIWRWPASSTPDQGSNTVLLGHRFTYTNPNGVLFHLDKVQPGDTIGMTWGGEQYVYTVQEVKTVPPSATEILAPTDRPTLTIYTCTPLWKPDNRLVVTAVSEGAAQ